jgi:hypothetical protein
VQSLNGFDDSSIKESWRYRKAVNEMALIEQLSKGEERVTLPQSELRYLVKIFGIKKKKYRDCLVGMAGKIYKVIEEHNVSLEKMVECGPPVLKRMEQQTPELVVPFVLAARNWQMKEVDGTCVPGTEGGRVIHVFLESIYNSGYSRYEQKELVARLVYGLINLLDPGSDKFFVWLGTIKDEFLDEGASLDSRLTLIENLGMLCKASPELYSKTMTKNVPMRAMRQKISVALFQMNMLKKK